MVLFTRFLNLFFSTVSTNLYVELLRATNEANLTVSRLTTPAKNLLGLQLHV